ncbi:DUF3060 domain-containing protein [Mycolicibacterium sp. HK-90]|uniref:DUF3060 domain-containing protein n=1 Tax=Mycolicibacterium sp. HK-90 TaxID=3056937 RepID=UPI00265A16C5|nr:DUF3060 domain-containing protein [Mycolicibacterium sp. HK-90]WKG02262.1 DUF3060 domain-containing protein [Mycolicibacterium sp. HK-90]
MDPKDDPEARIRELERPLAEAARASELGAEPTASADPPPTQPWTHGNTFPPPPPGPPAPWPGYEPYPVASPPPRSSGGTPFLILFGAVSMMLVAGGVAAYLMFSDSGTTGSQSDTQSDSQSTTIRETAVSRFPMPEPVAPTQVSPGETVIVSGIGENRTIDCRDNTVIVSGIENNLEITGHCVAVTVSGVDNVITVDSADTIGVSGFDNRVTFHTGQPDVSKSGQSNVVEQG